MVEASEMETPSTKIFIPDQWSDAAETIVRSSVDCPIAFICGPKNSGKTIFARNLVNVFLTRHKKVAYLDTDVGQPEFNPPGLLSLTVIDKLNPDLSNPCLETPKRCLFFGDISSKRSPAIYWSFVASLWDDYKRELLRSCIPLVINTAGWVKGIGYELLVEMVNHISPTHVVKIQISAERKNLPFGAFWSNDSNADSIRIIEIDDAHRDHLNRSVLTKKDGRRIRDFRIMAYLRQCFPSDYDVPKFGELAFALSALPPYEISIASIKIRHLHCQIPPSERFYSLNGTIVGLAVRSSTRCELHDCVGLGIVRGVDASRGVIFVVTPVPSAMLEKVDQLLQGFLQMPPCLLQARGCTSPYMSMSVRAHYKPQKPQPPPSPPSPPRPPKKPVTFTLHGETWDDEYGWMSQLHDKVAMRHMDVYLEQEEKYAEAVMYDSERLLAKLQGEMSSRLAAQLSTPALRWGPWLYYRRVEEGKQYPVLCRRMASLHEELISNKSPSAGFDFISGKKIEQKLIDYNLEAERFGGYAYEALSEVSPDHRYIAYTMYDKDTNCYKLSVRDLNFGSLCERPQANRVSGVAWAKNGQALLYVVTDNKMRPYRIYLSTIGSNEEDVLLFEDPREDVHLKLRHTKDFQFLTVNAFSPESSKIFLINAADPLSGMKLVWEGEPNVHCIIEHHQGFLYLFTNASLRGQSLDHYYLLRSRTVPSCGERKWEIAFIPDQDLMMEDVDFCNTHMVLIVRSGRKYGLCSIDLPLKNQKVGCHLRELNPRNLPLPDHVSRIFPGPNYDFYSPTMRFTVSSPIMPDAVVDYDLVNGKWSIVQQQNLLYERTRILYGSSERHNPRLASKSFPQVDSRDDDDSEWYDLSEYYACEEYDVPSHDGVLIPLTVVYSRHKKIKDDGTPGLLRGHGAYGEVLDKRWQSELKSLLDRGWVIAYADVRGGGGGGKKWWDDGRREKKMNSVKDYISCAEFLIEKGVVNRDKLAAWGYSAGGLLAASAINVRPDLFRAAILKVPFLDPTHTLMQPILPVTFDDYEEFGYPDDIEDFRAIREFSPYDNVGKGGGSVYPSIMITSSFHTRFGVWEAAKWAARVRERSIYDDDRAVVLNLMIEPVEDNAYLQCREAAMETAFLIKTLGNVPFQIPGIK
ncbi:hypothetical protein M569_06374 [Genlisea aurea]|uniref:Prolyl endopeptidase-like n=1 Tax=Genlisea aurea TaxID=192259 RepID=S8CML7_9LAMI|nr:hypothetical protein M569_06374 [Genlisea aurea]